jgi:signal peptidase I
MCTLAASSTAGEPVEYVKRVVAVGGDTVEILDGTVRVNGAARREEVRVRLLQPSPLSLPRTNAAATEPLQTLPTAVWGRCFAAPASRSRTPPPYDRYTSSRRR